ncbi:MAG TPA: ethanolamine utilization protein EutH [Ruminiclostridium sp.]|nr:ethanolamine utilization protein EutH [Ruminiclostridium sp.]
MSFSEILMFVIAVCAILGGIDKIIGNKFGLGEKFDEGFNAMGPLALGMVGIVCLAPVIAKVLGGIVTPALSAIGADPALFGSILPNDTGGYPLAMALAVNPQAGEYSGLIVAAMFGCTLTFSIPVGLSLIEKRDQPYFAKGLLIGFITIPIGCVIGGLIAGYNMGMVIMNTIPIAVLSILLAIGLKYIPSKLMKGCIIFGKIIVIIVTIGIACAAFEFITGIVIIPGMDPIEDAMGIIGIIGVTLLGTFPLLHILTKVLNKPLNALGQKIGLDSTSAAGLVFTLANSIPVYGMMKKMSPKGKIINTAWLVPATAALGDHLGFTAGVMPSAIAPMVISKLVAGVLAVLLTLLICKNTDVEDKMSAEIAAKEGNAGEEPAVA